MCRFQQLTAGLASGYSRSLIEWMWRLIVSAGNTAISSSLSARTPKHFATIGVLLLCLVSLYVYGERLSDEELSKFPTGPGLIAMQAGSDLRVYLEETDAIIKDLGPTSVKLKKITALSSEERGPELAAMARELAVIWNNLIAIKVPKEAQEQYRALVKGVWAFQQLIDFLSRLNQADTYQKRTTEKRIDFLSSMMKWELSLAGDEREQLEKMTAK